MKASIRIAKRLIDIVGSSVGIAALSPLMGAIALGIRATSPGPVLYRQVRAGRIDDGEGIDEFQVYKFRTMVRDAERGTGAVISRKGDARITPIGRLLRVTRLDELPQFFNVLRGEMSIVGPRPERPELIRNLSLAIPYFEERMRLIKPGITGLAQIHLGYSGRLREDSELARLKNTLVNPFDLDGVEDSEADDMRTKMLYDFAYSAALEGFWSFLTMDLGIMLKTPVVMFWSRTGT